MLFRARPCPSRVLSIGVGILVSLFMFTAPSVAQWLTARQPAVSKVSRRAKVSSQTFFDDFNYSNYKQLARHGWIIRTAAGWPGGPGAIWGNSGGSFPAYHQQHGTRLRRIL